MVLKFADFELDQQRAELRGSGGESIRLRPKAFAMLIFLASNARRVVSKQELMDAVWPNIHVGEDSLFQCIREIRSALGDDRRQLLKVVSGRGYLFEADVSGGQAEPAPTSGNHEPPTVTASALRTTGTKRRFFIARRITARVAAGIGICLIVVVAAVASITAGLIFKHAAPTVAVMKVFDNSDDFRGAEIASGVTERLIDGLAEVDNIRVVVPRSDASQASDFVLHGELQKDGKSWTLQARMIKASTGQIQAVATVSAGIDGSNTQLQQTRLAAGAGDILTRRLNYILEVGPDITVASGGNAKIVVDQAMASINQTSPERFAASQTMVEKALADEPGNIDLQVALAALQTRGIQMVWYGPAERVAAESGAKSLLEDALRVAPRYIPVLEAYCRFLSATNNFIESLVACAQVLNFAPWNGSALYQLGLTQIHLGRFEDALATFKQAERFDTPAVSRWTWLLGIGWANLLMGHNEEAVPWLERSIAITPASGRPYMLLAAAYQRLHRTDDAKAALTKALELRPGSTALNVRSPTRNVSPVFLETGQRLIQTLIEIGLPER